MTTTKQDEGISQIMRDLGASRPPSYTETSLACGLVPLGVADEFVARVQSLYGDWLLAKFCWQCGPRNGAFGWSYRGDLLHEWQSAITRQGISVHDMTDEIAEHFISVGSGLKYLTDEELARHNRVFGLE